MAAQSLQGEVDRILEILSSLPGSRDLEVKTRCYPRFLPGDAGTGYSEQSWHVTTFDIPHGVAIPADSEDIVFTWQRQVMMGQAGEAHTVSHLRQSVSAALAKLDWPTALDYDINVSAHDAEAPSIKVQMSRRC